MLLEVTVVAGTGAPGMGAPPFSPTELSVTWPVGVQRADCSGVSLESALAQRWPGCTFSVSGNPLCTLLAGTFPLVNGAIVVAWPEGSAVSLTSPEPSPASAGAWKAAEGVAAVLVISSGPGAGAVFALQRGSYTIGRGQCRICVADPSLSRHHGTLVVGAQNITLTAAHGSTGFMLRRTDRSPTASAVPLKGTTVLEVGHSITCGSSTLELRFQDSPVAAFTFSSTAPTALANAHSGSVAIDQVGQLPPVGPTSPPARRVLPRRGAEPWLLDPAALEPLAVPNSMGSARNRVALIIAGGLPLVLGTILALVTGSWMFLAFSVMGAMTVLVPLFGGSQRRRALLFAVEQATLQDVNRRFGAFPDAGTLTATVLVGDSHQQLRPPGMGIVLRIGTATATAAVILAPADPGFSAPRVPVLPFILALDTTPVTISGPGTVVQSLLNYVLMQLDAATVAVVLLGSPGSIPLAARFLPRTVLAQSGPAAHRALNGLRREGTVDGTAASGHRPTSSPAVLIVMNGPAEPNILSMPGLRVLRFNVVGCESPAPPLTGTVMLRAAGNRVDGTYCGQHFVPDGVPTAIFDAYARRSAGWAAQPQPGGYTGHEPQPVNNPMLGPTTGDWLVSNTLPAQLTAELQIHAWSRSAGGPLRPVLLGHSENGPTMFDFNHDGPHLLVGGTTGSGKSEFLRTLVGSLCAAHSPADLQFVFVDFKGGAGLGVLGKLPHTTSLITDLAGHAMERTLASLRAELHHREAALAAVEAADCDVYRAMAHRPEIWGTAYHHAMAHLVIVIDEFRVLVDQYPDAMAELMRIAAVGRSLGIHLVMATQRPQGALNADIRANVTSSICLRVQSVFDSTDVIGTGVAATISVSTPGRAYISRAGAAPEEFQSATLHLPAVAAGQLPLVALTPDRLAVEALSPALAGALPTCTGTQASEVSPVAELMAKAWQQSQTSRPTLHAAPAVVAAELPPEISASRSAKNADKSSLLLGMVDVPQRQSLEPLHWNPQQHSHLACFGTSAETSKALALVASQLLAANQADFSEGRFCPYLLYLLDGDGSLGSFATNPWVGSHITPDNLRTAAHLVHRLAQTTRTSATPLVLCITDWGRWVAALRSSPWHGSEDALAELIRFKHPNLVVAVGGGRELLGATFLAAIPNRFFLTYGSSNESMMLWPRLPRFNALSGRAAIAGPSNAQAGQEDSETMHIAQLCRPAQKRASQLNVHPLLPAGPPPGHYAQDTLCVTPLPEYLSMAQTSAAVQNCPDVVCRAGSGTTAILGMGGDGRDLVRLTLAPGTVLPVIGGPGAGKSSFIRTLSSLNGGASRDSLQAQAPPWEAGDVLWLDDVASLTPEELLRATASLASGIAIVAAFSYPGPALSKLPLEWGIRTAQQGIILMPQRPSDGELFGIRLDTSGTEPPGRGVVLERGRHCWFQFPNPQ